MTSLALNLSIFFVVLASICYSVPIVHQTTMESELFETTEMVPRALPETNEIDSSSGKTTGKDEEEMTTVSAGTSSKSSHDKESEDDESRETREFSEMNTSESPMTATGYSASYSDKDAHYDRTSTTVQPRWATETQQVPSESSTTMRMTSTSTRSSSSSEAPEKYPGRLEDQNEPSENVEKTTKSSRRMAKKPMEQHEEEHYRQQPAAEETTMKGDYQAAEYSPKALNFISPFQSNDMQYNGNNRSVSNFPLTSTTTELPYEEHSKSAQHKETIDQAQKPSVPEKEKSNH